MPECITKDSLLQPPQSELTFPDSGIMSPPFTLKGAPLTNKPQSLSGVIERKRKPDARNDISNLESYFADDNYTTESIQTPNIIEGNINSTLRFGSTNYTLKFVGLHRNIWEPKSNQPQVSALFISSEGNFFHLCIPVSIQADKANENSFLKFWLKDGEFLPNGFTFNDILNFRNSDVRFATLEYCLQYNGSRSLKPYVFCLFKTPLFLDSTNLPRWFAEDPTFTKTTNRYNTFDQIFNCVLRGEVSKFVFDRPDPYLTSDEAHFDSARTQNAIFPTYYKVKSSQISGKLYQGFSQSIDGVRRLNNVKCYPIDLASQIDDEGVVVVDESTNKPIDLSSVNYNQSSSENINLPNVRIKEKKNQNNIMYIVAFSIIGLILLAVVISSIVWFFQANTGEEIAAMAVPLASVGARVNSNNSSVKVQGIQPSVLQNSDENEKIKKLNKNIEELEKNLEQWKKAGKNFKKESAAPVEPAALAESVEPPAPLEPAAPFTLAPLPEPAAPAPLPEPAAPPEPAETEEAPIELSNININIPPFTNSNSKNKIRKSPPIQNQNVARLQTRGAPPPRNTKTPPPPQ